MFLTYETRHEPRVRRERRTGKGEGDAAAAYAALEVPEALLPGPVEELLAEGGDGDAEGVDLAARELDAAVGDELEDGHRVVRVRGAERPVAFEHLENEDAEGPEVDVHAVALAERALGAQVLGRADDREPARRARAFRRETNDDEGARGARVGCSPTRRLAKPKSTTRT